MVAKMITFFPAILAFFSFVTAAKFNVTGVKWRLFTTLIVCV